MIKAVDFEGYVKVINMARNSIRDKAVSLDANVDLCSGEVIYIVSDCENKTKVGEYKNLEAAIVMYNKALDNG